MSRAKTVLTLAIVMLVASAFLVVAQDSDLTAGARNAERQLMRAPPNAAADGAVEASFSPGQIDPTPYPIDSIPLFEAFAQDTCR